jgi:hypothetical protein
MFGFGKKGRDTDPSKRSKSEERHFERKDHEALQSFFGSAKERSDKKAARGWPPGR